jgi:hypothetical protein
LVWKKWPKYGWTSNKECSHDHPEKCDIPLGRITPSLEIYKNKLYLFGGDLQHHKGGKWRYVDDGLYEYNLDSSMWRQIKPAKYTDPCEQK